ncbi:MAG: sel1 repeat family protein [Alphaproteobacteria bacterium]|nr:sel1 repeat family protein [Alphaproteobacteria bacterium]
MQISSLTSGRVFACLIALAIGVAAPAHAFDPDSGVSEKSGPRVLFKFGFSAYKRGKKDDAVEAYRHAADQGHRGARWALANMYADGDGVVEDDYEAFKIYDQITRQGVEPGSQDTGFFVNALVSLAGYYRRGIPNSPVRADLAQARELYFHAASVFGIPEAQFQLGRMILLGEGGKSDLRQGKKWLNRARKAGHPGASALLGDTIFQEGHTVRGLAYMTVALERAPTSDREWIRSIQEQAFSVAGEADRRTAMALAENMLTKGSN